MPSLNIKVLFLIAFILAAVIVYWMPQKEAFNPAHIFDRGVSISSYKGNAYLPLQNYMIKSSYNSAIDDNDFVSKDAIKYVIGRGCRFLDFEVMVRDGQIVVGRTTDKNYELTETRNHIPIESALETAMGYGFVNSTPNPTDPLFLHLRIKVNDQDYNAYGAIAKSVSHIVGDRLYKGRIDPSVTPLHDLKRKVVLIVDNTYDPSFKTRTQCNATDKCYDLGKLMNLESGTKEMCRKKRFVDLLDEPQFSADFNNNGAITNRNGLVIGVPEFYANSDIGAPLIYSLVKSQCIQIPCYRMHFKSRNLHLYDEFFNHHNSAIVPLENALAYARRATE